MLHYRRDHGGGPGVKTLNISLHQRAKSGCREASGVHLGPALPRPADVSSSRGVFCSRHATLIASLTCVYSQPPGIPRRGAAPDYHSADGARQRPPLLVAL